MCAVKREIGQFVVELSATQLNDVSLASLMIRMACAALTGAGVGHEAMIAAVQTDVGSNILVTIQAQRGLRSYVGTIMTVRAALLLLDMGLSQFARHQQRFYVGGAHGAHVTCKQCCEDRHGAQQP